jgi:hypothetical protein
VPGSTWLEMSRASRLTDFGRTRLSGSSAFRGCQVGYLSGQERFCCRILAVEPGCAVCRIVLASRPTCEV